MKTVILATLALLIAAGPSMASPWNGNSHRHGHGHGHGVLTRYERVMIAKSKHRLMRLKWRARADGRISRFERFRIRHAQRRHNRLVARAWRS